MIDTFVDPTIIIFAKLAFAAFLGMLLGTERMVAGKGAGTRTFALVSLGACLMVVISSHVDNAYLGFVNFDPLRVAAAVIMGIGFLGGGIIVLRDHESAPRGITTAAGIWVASAVGMAVGFGMYAVATFTTALILLIFTAVWFGEHKLQQMFVRNRPTTFVKEGQDAHESHYYQSHE